MCRTVGLNPGCTLESRGSCRNFRPQAPERFQLCVWGWGICMSWSGPGDSRVRPRLTATVGGGRYNASQPFSFIRHFPTFTWAWLSSSLPSASPTLLPMYYYSFVTKWSVASIFPLLRLVRKPLAQPSPLKSIMSFLWLLPSLHLCTSWHLKNLFFFF